MQPASPVVGIVAQLLKLSIAISAVQSVRCIAALHCSIESVNGLLCAQVFGPTPALRPAPCSQSDETGQQRAQPKLEAGLRLEQQQGLKAEVTRQIKACEKQIEQTLDKIVASNSATVVAAFEKRIEELEREKQILNEKRDQVVKPKRQFKDVFEPAMEFLSNPCKLNEIGSFTMKRIVLKLAFKPLIPYTKETGARTAQPSEIFDFLTKSHQIVKWCAATE
jgi:hypothetical protein